MRKYYKNIQIADVLIRNNGLKVGETILVFGKKMPASCTVVCEIQQEQSFLNRIAKGKHAGIKIPFAVKKGDKVFLWQKKHCLQDEKV